jgi:hypothetical protein
MRSERYFCIRSNRTGARPASGMGLRAGATALCLAASLFGQELPPVVTTQFEIEAGSFSRLKPQVRAQCEDAVSLELAQLGANYFRCFRWMALTNDAAVSNSAATLKLKLLQEDRGYGYEFLLGYFRLAAGQSTAFGSLPPKILWAATELDPPTQDAKRLETEVVAELRRQFDNQSVRKQLLKEFLSSIPLTRTLEMATNVERVIIPISQEWLRAGEQSVLRLTFKTLPPGARLLPVEIKMSPREENLPASWGTNVGCLVIEFDRPPVFSKDKWHPLIPESYAQRVDGSVEVYMHEYFPDYSAGMTRGPTGTVANRP